MPIFRPQSTPDADFSSILRGGDSIVKQHVLVIVAGWDFVWKGASDGESLDHVQGQLDAIHRVMASGGHTCADAFMDHAAAVAFCLGRQPGSVPERYQAMPPGWSIEWQQDGSGKVSYTEPAP